MSEHRWRQVHRIFATASILWVGLMSCWANAAGHFAGYQGARSEEKQEQS